MPCTLSVQPQKSKVSRKKEELLDAQNTKLVEKKKPSHQTRWQYERKEKFRQQG